MKYFPTLVGYGYVTSSFDTVKGRLLNKQFRKQITTVKSLFPKHSVRYSNCFIIYRFLYTLNMLKFNSSRESILLLKKKFVQLPPIMEIYPILCSPVYDFLCNILQASSRILKHSSAKKCITQTTVSVNFEQFTLIDGNA